MNSHYTHWVNAPLPPVTLGDDGDEAGDNLLMDRAVLEARVRWKPNLTETERESGSLFLL